MALQMIKGARIEAGTKEKEKLKVCCSCTQGTIGCTPPKTNMEPQNGGLEDDFPFQTGDFQVPC